MDFSSFLSKHNINKQNNDLRSVQAEDSTLDEQNYPKIDLSGVNYKHTPQPPPFLAKRRSVFYYPSEIDPSRKLLFRKDISQLEQGQTFAQRFYIVGSGPFSFEIWDDDRSVRLFQFTYDMPWVRSTRSIGMYYRDGRLFVTDLDYGDRILATSSQMPEANEHKRLSVLIFGSTYSHLISTNTINRENPFVKYSNVLVRKMDCNGKVYHENEKIDCPYERRMGLQGGYYGRVFDLYTDYCNPNTGQCQRNRSCSEQSKPKPLTVQEYQRENPNKFVAHERRRESL